MSFLHPKQTKTRLFHQKQTYQKEASSAFKTFFGLGDLNLEYILVKNEGDSKLSLLNWSLRGAERKSIHIKSDIILNPGGAIKIYSKTGTDSALAIYLNSEEAFWQSGAIVTLHDPELVERARYEIP